jgi:hypothetical protein
VNDGQVLGRALCCESNGIHLLLYAFGNCLSLWGDGIDRNMDAVTEPTAELQWMSTVIRELLMQVPRQVGFW